MIYFGTDTKEEELENINDDDASIDDDLLDEVTGEKETSDDEEVEGFGLVDESEEEDGEEEEKEAELEEDAEDVDYDSFDDVDEL